MDVSGQPLHKYSDMSPSFRMLLCHQVGWYKADFQFLVELKRVLFLSWGIGEFESCVGGVRNLN